MEQRYVATERLRECAALMRQGKAVYCPETLEAAYSRLTAPGQPVTEAFLEDIVNTTTGWAAQGFKSAADALWHVGETCRLQRAALAAPERSDPLVDLVSRFGAALLAKLQYSKVKRGYGDEWLETGWRESLCGQMAEHVRKGDPRDVAAYCAFAWHHGWSVEGAAPAQRVTKNALVEIAKTAAIAAGKNARVAPQLLFGDILLILQDAFPAAPEQPASDAAAAPFPYQRTFDAIAAATRIEGGHVAVSVKRFVEVFGDVAVVAPEQPVTEEAASLRAALQFYADPHNWIDTPSWDGDPICYTPKAIPVTNGDGRPCDCGDVARAALSGQPASDANQVPAFGITDTLNLQRVLAEQQTLGDPRVRVSVPTGDEAPAAPAPIVQGEGTYQRRVHAWILACFGPEIGADRVERNHRFIEEALELVQSGGATASECHQLVDYVFGRAVGDLTQEVGGVLNTLAALCTAHGVDMNVAGEKELTRVWTKVETIRAKQKAKPKHSPLPVALQPPAGAA